MILLLRKPDYLRSEEYHLQKLSMELMGEKGAEFAATADHLVAIANPRTLPVRNRQGEDQ